MDLLNKNMKKEMTDFVSFYRRFNNVAGKQSFSTLYTAINGNEIEYFSFSFSCSFFCMSVLAHQARTLPVGSACWPLHLLRNQVSGSGEAAQASLPRVR